MKFQEILFEADDIASTTDEAVQPELIKTRRGYMVWFEQGDGLRKYAIAKLSKDGEVLDVQSAVTSRNGIKQLYSRKQAKAISAIVAKEHAGTEPRMIKASLEQYEDGTISVNVG